MYIVIRVESESGVDTDLNEVTDQEQVSNALAKSALLDPIDFEPETADPEPADATRFDRHRHEINHIGVLDRDVLHGQPGHWANDQLDVFVCRRCGMAVGAPSAIPRSGYRITRMITTVGHDRLRFTVRKESRGCDVGTWTTDAGPSGPFEVTHDIEVTLPKGIEALQQLMDEMPVLRRG